MTFVERQFECPTSAGTRLRAVAFAVATTICLGVGATAETLVIDGGTVHPVSAEPFVGRVVVVDGAISEVGPSVAIPDGARVIDAKDHHVYPGFVDALSQLGLIEVGAVPATDDQAEMGLYNPHLHATTAVHPSSELIPVARANGITHSLVAPESDDGVIAGQAAVLHLDGWTVEEMEIAGAAAMVVDWPEIRTRRFDFATFSMKETPFNEAKDEATEKVNELAAWLDAARHYKTARESGSQRLERDVRLEALAGCLDGGQRMVIKVNRKRDIEAAMKFAKKHDLNVILAGVSDGWEVAGELAESGIPVILGTVQSLPAEADDPYDRPFKNAAALVDAGVKIAFGSGAGGGFGPGGAHNSRHLPYEAATAMAHGLSGEDALKALTIWPAEMLGVGDQVGTIESGKLANLIVTDGDPFEITTQVTHVLIDGREISTANLHRDLYEKYRAR